MFKNTIKNLTLSYILIVVIITFSISCIVYYSVVRSTENILKIEEIRVIQKFGYGDPYGNKKIEFAEKSIESFKRQTIIVLTLLNVIILTIVGFLSYLLARKNLLPIEQSMKRQKEFISNISHELKTPLTALKSSFEIELRSKYPDYKNTLISGIDDVDKLNSLINAFLKLSLLENNQYKIKNEEIKLKEILDVAIKPFINDILEKRIDIIYDLQEKILVTDKFLFLELLTVFIANSIKFNKQNGKIIIKSYQQNNQDVISIYDSGIGIDKEKIHKIFERFYKEDESRNKEGHGIGLSIAQEISKILNAKISVISEKNIMTEIKISFSGIFKN